MKKLQRNYEHFEILHFENEELLRQEILKDSKTEIMIPPEEKMILDTFQALKLPNIYAFYRVRQIKKSLVEIVSFASVPTCSSQIYMESELDQSKSLER